MSFEEKSVWFQLIGLILGVGVYVAFSGPLFASGEMAISAYAVGLVVAVIAMVVFQIVAHTLAAIASNPEQRDERDRMIIWKSSHQTSWVSAIGMLGAIVCLVMKLEAVWIANILLFALMASEVSALTLRGVYYRKGA